MALPAASDSRNKTIKFLDSLADPSLDTSSKSINNHLAQIDNEITRVQLNEMDQKLNDPQTISIQHSESSQNLKAIQSLSAAYEKLSTLSSLVYSDDLVTAVSNLPPTKSEVELLKQYQSVSSLAKRAIHRIQELEEDLKQRLIDDVRACFTFHDGKKTPEDSIFEFNMFVNARAPQQTESLIRWSSAVEGLQALSGNEFITLQFQKIANITIEKIIAPLIDSLTNASTHLKLVPAQKSDESPCVLTFEQQADGNRLDLYDSFRLLFSTLQERLLTKPLQKIFSQQITPLLETKLLTEALDSGLPNSSRDKTRLSQLTDLLDQTRLFGNWLQDHDWLPNPHENSLLEWCEQVQERFLQKVATRVLECARTEMVFTQWQSVLVPWEIIPEVENLPSPRKESGADSQLPRETSHPSSSTSVLASDDRSSESLQTSAGFRSLFNLASSSSQRIQSPSDNTPSKPSSQEPGSFPSPASKNFRSLFNFGIEQENGDHAEKSASKESVVEEFEEQAWGLEEPNDPDLDAWGLESEEPAQSEGDAMRLRGGLPSPVPSEVDDDGWGWSDDLPTETSTEKNDAQNITSGNKVANTSTSHQVPPGTTVRVEQLTISTLAQRVLEIVQEVVDDAAETEKPEIVMIVHHSKLLDSVPSLSVQFSNDCDWLSKQLHNIPRLNELQETKILSERLKSLAVVVRKRQLANQRAALMECLDEAEGFVKTSREDRFLACDRACKQVAHTLASLAQVWKPVMLRSEYLRSLGSLVESVLQRILNEIKEQVDIEESDSKQLNTICKSLHSLIDLFNLQPDFDPADIYRYLPSGHYVDVSRGTSE
ncbi:hypothetical protein VP01_69g5 [Puccinia sorghi]|uniref:ZW10 C-terminal helical domain-containing protein n=1 Tax=Puccinia sorghi TaxID=27349 RepID=A0A0L6UER1_9BASI|nr:hypothetical protein VP01_69g5 [Puccinia sorghi]